MAVRRPNDGPTGEGSFTWRGKHATATAAARGEFLRLVTELAPAVVSSLYSAVRPAFSRLIVERGWAVADAISSREEDPLAVLKRKSEGAASAQPFLDALSRWSTRWKIKAPWIDRWVLITLHRWWQADPRLPADQSADSSSPSPAPCAAFGPSPRWFAHLPSPLENVQSVHLGVPVVGDVVWDTLYSD